MRRIISIFLLVFVGVLIGCGTTQESIEEQKEENIKEDVFEKVSSLSENEVLRITCDCSRPLPTYAILNKVITKDKEDIIQVLDCLKKDSNYYTDVSSMYAGGKIYTYIFNTTKGSFTLVTQQYNEGYCIESGEGYYQIDPTNLYNCFNSGEWYYRFGYVSIDIYDNELNKLGNYYGMDLITF